MFENYKAVQMSDVTFWYKFLDYFPLKYLAEFNFFIKNLKLPFPHFTESTYNSITSYTHI